jgi:hypothetical protein
MAKKKSGVNWKELEKWVETFVLAGCKTPTNKVRALSRRIESLNEFVKAFEEVLDMSPDASELLEKYLLDSRARKIVLIAYRLRLNYPETKLQPYEETLKRLDTLAR